MTTSTHFKDWWQEARKNGGKCEFWHAWWDSNGGKTQEEKIIPGALSDKQLLDTITPSALMKLPAHYYANYTDATWYKLAEKTGLAIVKKDFSLDGARVDAVMRVDVYKSMFIDTAAMADAVDKLFTRWEHFSNKYPGSGMSLTIRSENKVPVIKTNAYHGCSPGELMVSEAAFDVLMADLKTDPNFAAWLENIVTHRGNNPKSFSITEEVWFGNNNPTMERVRFDMSGGKRGKGPNIGMVP